MKIAAIDIGSNAARMQISSVLTNKNKISFKKVEYVRFALRLGMDVFNTGSISHASEARIKKLLQAYQLLMELHEVDAYMICATSAMREAENGASIVERIFNELGMEIHLIEGEQEAELINNVIVTVLDDDKTYLHIDVGGGSTELNIYKGHKKVTAKSFKIGSVRLLEHKEAPDVWKKMQVWVNENIPKGEEVIAVGTGGNVSKLFNMIEGKKDNKASLKDLEKMRNFIEKFSLEERINRLQLNADRADVIVPASDIYISVMKWAGANEIMVPDLGLKDGILMLVYETLMNEE
ncbi:Ppx/GppA phosphatase [Emticicia oligotrophica DSM 17448]|uniref:Ppx/GppA phosphatase n=1 Tax=Emticicia oligotrophica (strain DSM 17448 / CIP 109782 / MTCC 6937 / GPTSA100-15) TaxID=929562 RepID=A0ABN4ANS1_EMTOG|nr:MULTISPECIES: phosphatase [Emticicia]AFK03818.1 Ppx/GppA phosphatase [Emticicia oligotrophica DSM 17448]